MGGYMVMFSVTYMGFSVFVLLTAMVNGPKFGHCIEMTPGHPDPFRCFLS